MKTKQQPSQNTKRRYLAFKCEESLPSFISFKLQYQSLFNQQRIQAVKQIYHHGVAGKSSGNLVVVDRVGNLKIQDLSRVFEEDEIVGYVNQRLIELSERILGPEQQVIWIIDLSGKIMQLASKKILDSIQKIIKNAQKYFPGILHKLIFVNTPMLFDTIWSKISMTINQNAQNKVIMLGEQIQQLFQFVDKQALPESLGGNFQDQVWLYGSKDNNDHQDSSSQQQVDLNSLKQALGGLKLGGASKQTISQTPLNTQADQK